MNKHTNIVVKKHLLSKLEQLKSNRKGRSQAVKRTPLRRRSVRRTPLITQARRSVRRTPSITQARRTPLRRRSVRRTRKVNPINSLQLPYIRKIRKLNNIFPKSRNNSNNLNNGHICRFKNFHEEDIEIPNTYPGDLWVHNNLVVDRDKPLEYFDEDYLKEVYANHKKICYGI